jgi:chromosome segregation ATPase
MLSDMYHTFTNNLQTSTAEEAKAHRNYEDLIATYQEELAKLQETLVKKEAAKTEDEIQLADATQTFADSEDQLKAEINVFDTTKESCSEKTEDWSKRSSLRKMELDGVKKALEVLTSDEAKELFAKSIKPGFSGGGASSFIQVASLTDTATGDQKALTVLEKRAEESHSFRLAALAADIRMQDHGHFDAVIKSIDDLLAQLDEEEKEDIAKVDSCKEEYKDLTSSKNDLDWKIENNKAKVQKHEKAISQKTEAKEVTIESIEDADKQLADMLKERKEGNDAYKKAKDDDEKAIALLRKANQALAKYYETALLQQPDLKLSDKDSASNQTQGVVSLIDMIITDLTQELAEGKAAEKAAQLAYEKMKQSIEDQKAKLEKKKINLEGQIAEEGTSKTAEEDLQKENEDDLDNTKKTEADLKKTCDDAIRLQPERRKKRKIEADGLNQAKEFLAGMSSDAFLQTPRHDAGRGAIPTFRTLSFLQRSRSL